jgi:hypothetical protein
MFAFGIEHEVAFLNQDGQFVDFVSTPFAALGAIIEELPFYEEDYPQLRIGAAGIKRKRWYIEGFERYDLSGKFTSCPPKGIEIRTTIHNTIQGAVDELSASFDLLLEKAARVGFSPVFISFNPFRTAFIPDPPLNEYEWNRRKHTPEKRTAVLPMLTYGPDLNFSLQGLTAEEIIDIGCKLTYYSPYIIPFSFSSPFYDGALWEGLSVRTFKRTGARPAAMVYLEKSEELITSNPTLTKIARLPAEIGRIEFKAFDSCADFELYASLLALLKGLALDDTLPGRATIPDAALHQRSARGGFSDELIAEGSAAVLRAAALALQDDADQRWLGRLDEMFEYCVTPAHDLIQVYQETDSIVSALRSPYEATLERIQCELDVF